MLEEKTADCTNIKVGNYCKEFGSDLSFNHQETMTLANSNSSVSTDEGSLLTHKRYSLLRKLPLPLLKAYSSDEICLKANSFSSDSDSEDDEVKVSSKVRENERRMRIYDNYLRVIGVVQHEKPEMSEIEKATVAHFKFKKRVPKFINLKFTTTETTQEESKPFSSLSSLLNKVISRRKTEVEEEVKSEDFQLGLRRGCVIERKYYRKEQRRNAQNGLLCGKRNIAFLDEVQVMDVPHRKEIPKEIRHKMFYTRSQFLRMISTNLKQIEQLQTMRNSITS